MVIIPTQSFLASNVLNWPTVPKQLPVDGVLNKYSGVQNATTGSSSVE